jgi:hypothetical protein
MTARHSAEAAHLIRWVEPNPRLDGVAVDVSVACHRFTEEMRDLLTDGPELLAGLRKVLEAKDCFVRQALDDSQLGINEEDR